MDNFSYQIPTGGTTQVLHSGYLIGTPKPPSRAFHQIVALLAVAGLIVAGVGLVVSLITTDAWASVALIVGLGIFCLAGYLARYETRARGGTRGRGCKVKLRQPAPSRGDG